MFIRYGANAEGKPVKKADIYTAEDHRIDPGLIDAGAVHSPTQYVLELELNAGLVRSNWEVPVDEEHIARDSKHISWAELYGIC